MRPIPGSSARRTGQGNSDGVLLYAVGRKILRIVPAQPDGKANPFEGRIVRPLDDGIVRERPDDLLRYGVAGCQVIYGDLAAVHGYAEKEDFKIRGLGVLIHAAFFQIDIGKSLHVDG